jgi:hypothetical protein
MITISISISLQFELELFSAGPVSGDMRERTRHSVPSDQNKTLKSNFEGATSPEWKSCEMLF